VIRREKRREGERNNYVKEEERRRMKPQSVMIPVFYFSFYQWDCL
jgi:hypothetical protein